MYNQNLYEYTEFIKQDITSCFIKTCPPEYNSYLNTELEIIRLKKFEIYFLQIIWILRKAKEKFGNFPYIVRGSGGSSLISWLCGISILDPIQYKFHYVRFINQYRMTQPDIDVDFPHTKVDKHISSFSQSSSFSHIKLVSGKEGSIHLTPASLPPVIFRQLFPNIKILLLIFFAGIR